MTVSNKKVQEALGIPLPDYGPKKFDPLKRIKLSDRAPVVELKSGVATITEKIFPVNPFPNSRLSGLGSLDEGAGETESDQDIRRIYEVPLWKKSFSDSPLVVPMTSFFEPVYWGAAIGTVQEFRMPGEDVFFVAGMSIKTRIPKSETINGFSLFTHTATPQMLKYHQRLVTILKKEDAVKYLAPMAPEERFQFLIDHRFVDELVVSKDRTMAKGWEKRIAIQESKLRREENYVAALKREKVKG